MNRRVLLVVAVTLFSLNLISQQTANVPRLLRYGAAVKSADGTPRTGVVGVMFSLYTEQQGGTALWTELQNVTLDASGQYTVLLGSQHSEGVPAELFTTNEARWLGIQVEAEPEQARVLLVSVPYALKAGDAETLGGKPVSAFLLNPNAENGGASGTATTSTTATSSATNTTTIVPSSVDTAASGGTANYVARWSDATTLGNSLLYDTGTALGIGTTSPATLLQVAKDANFRSDLGAAMMISGATTPTKRLMFGYDTTSDAGYIQSTEAGVNVKPLLFNPGGGFVGLGTSAPQAVMHVAQDSAYTSDLAAALLISNKTTPAKRLMFGYDATLDAAYLQSTFSGVNVRPIIMNPGGGSVGINTLSPTSPLTVAGTIQSTSGGFKFPDASVQTSAGVSSVSASAGINGNVASGVLTLTGDTAYLQRRISGTCAAGSAVSIVNSDGTVGCQTVGSGGGSVVPPLILSANVVGGGTDPTKLSTIYGANTAVGVLNPDPSSNFPPAGIVGHASNAAATGFTIGVLGRTDAPVGAGVLAMATGDGTQSDRATALTAFTTSATGRTKAIEATVNSSNSTVLSLKGPSGATLLDANIGTLTGGSNGPSMFHLDTTSASFSVNSFNVVGQSGPTSVQIYGGTQVNGNLSVTGTLSKASGSFKIDHPLDPANKYLYHSFVESPDMMNVYNGVIVLDAHGQAWVQLPDYFEALNQDFRYQLTAIGAPGPNLYVAKEVSGNRFRIAGGKPHAKVSWQVTGIRHDAYANANRIPNVVEKPGAERGTYLHPELFGHDASVAKIGAAAPSSPAATTGENK